MKIDELIASYDPVDTKYRNKFRTVYAPSERRTSANSFSFILTPEEVDDILLEPTRRMKELNVETEFACVDCDNMGYNFDGDISCNKGYNGGTCPLKKSASLADRRKPPKTEQEQLSLDCYFCRNHSQGDTIYERSDWDGGVGFDRIPNIKYCPMCGRELFKEED